MLKFILTLVVVSIISGLVFIISDNQKTGKKILATVSTIGLFYALGTTVFWFLNFIIAGVIMYFYTNSKDIEETLLKIIVLTSTIGILGWWRQSHKEGFFVSPLRYIGPAFTAKQCQDACQGTLGCKYAQVPLATSNSGMKNKCWNSYGLSQNKWGSQSQGGETWLNKLWKPPITLPISGGSYSGVIQTSSSPYRKLIRSEYVGGEGMIPEEVYLHADMRDQGWGNPTYGVYVEGYDKSGKLVFSKSLKAPRTSREVKYPTYTRRAYYATRCYYYWLFWFRKKICYPYSSYRTVFNGYKTKTVQGGLSHKDKTWKLTGDEQKTVALLQCFVKTQGSGHSLRAQSIRWNVKGWKK